MLSGWYYLALCGHGPWLGNILSVASWTWNGSGWKWRSKQRFSGNRHWFLSRDNKIKIFSHGGRDAHTLHLVILALFLFCFSLLMKLSTLLQLNTQPPPPSHSAILYRARRKKVYPSWCIFNKFRHQMVHSGDPLWQTLQFFQARAIGLRHHYWLCSWDKRPQWVTFSRSIRKHLHSQPWQDEVILSWKTLMMSNQLFFV